jgi:hypothetical protein
VVLSVVRNKVDVLMLTGPRKGEKGVYTSDEVKTKGKMTAEQIQMFKETGTFRVQPGSELQDEKKQAMWAMDAASSEYDAKAQRSLTAPPSTDRPRSEKALTRALSFGGDLMFDPDSEELLAPNSRSGRPCPWSPDEYVPDKVVDDSGVLLAVDKKRVQRAKGQRAPTMPASLLPAMDRFES